jgi:5S rRNA maturation endonuclease (ribonuclease M5)
MPAIGRDGSPAKQAFKLRLLADLYRAEFAIIDAALLHWVRHRPGVPEIVVALSDGRRIRDDDRHIRLQGQHDDQAVQLMVTMAMAKGWQRLTTSGDEAFRAAVRAEGHRLGITVDGILPPSFPLAPTMEALHGHRIGTLTAQPNSRTVPGYHAAARRVDRALERSVQAAGRLGERLRGSGPALERGVRRMSEDLAAELDHFKRDINLAAFAADSGYALDRTRSSRRCLIMANARGDKIAISRQINGHWTYFSVRDEQDNGSIIDFIQRRNGSSLGEVRKSLRAWMGEQPRKSWGEVPKDLSPTDRDGATMLREWHKTKGVVGDHRFLAQRGLSGIGDDATFTGTIRSDARGNVVFPHYDADGELSGFEIRNHGFKGFSSGGRKGLWRSNKVSGAQRVVICESPLDCMAYHRLRGDDATLYLATGGSMSPTQLAVLRTTINKIQATQVIIATDNDEGGEALATAIEDALASSVQVERDCPENAKDWNDVLAMRTTRPSRPVRRL